MNQETIKLKRTKNNQFLLSISIVICMMIWGFSWPSAKILSRYGSPESIAATRFILVFVSMLLLLLSKKSKLTIKPAGIPWLLLSGFLLAAYNYIYLQGLYKGMAGKGGILVCTLNPLMAYVLGTIISKAKPGVNEIIGIVIGLIAGLFLLRIWDNTGDLFSGGNSYFLIAAFTWALLSKTTAKSSSFGSSMGFSLWLYLVTSLFLLLLVDFDEMTILFQITDWVFWGNMFFFSIITTTVATTVFFYATTEIGAEKASSYILLVPVAVGLSAWIILNEQLEWHTIVGGLLGITAVYLINRKSREQKKLT